MADKVRELAETFCFSWQTSDYYERLIRAKLVPLLEAASSIAHCCSRESCPTRQAIYKLADELQGWRKDRP